MQTANILFPHLEKKVAERHSAALRQHYTYDPTVAAVQQKLNGLSLKVPCGGFLKTSYV